MKNIADVQIHLKEKGILELVEADQPQKPLFKGFYVFGSADSENYEYTDMFNSIEIPKSLNEWTPEVWHKTMLKISYFWLKLF